MEQKDILFIVNPKSGSRGKQSICAVIDRCIDRERFRYAVTETRYVGHASELAAEAAERGVYAVVAVGGDGTVNEVGRALVGTETALGVLPCGSGNGFARHLGIPMNLKKALRFINASEPSVIDYGKINGSPFFCTCGMGFDASVSLSFSKGKHRGFLSYIFTTVREFITYRPDEYEIETEGDIIKGKAFLVACGNASQYGNDFYVTPGASMKDGLLNVTVLEPFPFICSPKIIMQFFRNRIDRNPRAKIFMVQSLKIRRSSAGAVHFDGEPVGMGTEFIVEVVPAALNVLGAPGWNGSYKPEF